MGLRKIPAKTLPELASALVQTWSTNGGTTRVEPFQLSQAGDWKSWLQPHLEKRLHNHTSAHQYLFKMQEYHGSRRACMNYKIFSCSPGDYQVTGPVLVVSSRAERV